MVVVLVAFVVCLSVGVLAAPDITTNVEMTWGNTGSEGWLRSCVDGAGSGNIYMVGATDGPVGTTISTFLSPNEGYTDAFLTKFNSNGVVVWMRVIASPREDVALDVKSDAQGYIYVAGYTRGNLFLGTSTPLPTKTGGVSNYDTFLIKYNAIGDRIWASNAMASTVGYSGGDDYVNAIFLKDTFVYMVGSYNSDYQSDMMWVAKVSQTNGAVVWLTRFGETGSYKHSFGLNVHVDANDYVYVVGDTRENRPIQYDAFGNAIPGWTNMGARDGFVIMYSAASATLLAHWIIGTTADDVAYGVTTDGLGGLYIIGGTQGSMHGAPYTGANWNSYIVKYQLGSPLTTVNRVWTREFGPQSSLLRYLVYDGVGGLYTSDVWGGSGSQFGRNLRKMDTNGNLVWTYVLPGFADSITLTNNGVLITTGQFTGTYNLQPSAGGTDAFIRVQTINYNCSCSDLAGLVDRIEDLLNIAPVF